MTTQFVFFCALAFGHLVIARQEPTPSVATGLISSIVHAISGGIKPSPHIVGGKEVEPHSHPHQVALYSVLEGGEEVFCGGSLIAPQWILTAVHCLEEVNDMMAILGAHYFSSPKANTQIMHVEKFVSHENWNNRTYDDDIALLKLEAEVNLDENVQTIRLPSLALKDQSLSQTPVVMTGWGQYSDRKIRFSPFLRSAESFITSATFCNLYYGEISGTMICIDGLRRGSVCSGDSGGPLTTTESDRQRTLVGVTSFGFMLGCELGYPTVFTRVDQYLEWIANYTDIQLRES